MNEDSLCQTVNPALAGIESFGGASGQESALTTKGKAGEPEECTTRNKATGVVYDTVETMTCYATKYSANRPTKTICYC
jgi:hypothetical protein